MDAAMYQTALDSAAVALRQHGAIYRRGTLEEAEDVAHEALISYLENDLAAKAADRGHSPKTYLKRQVYWETQESLRGRCHGRRGRFNSRVIPLAHEDGDLEVPQVFEGFDEVEIQVTLQSLLTSYQMDLVSMRLRGLSFDQIGAEYGTHGIKIHREIVKIRKVLSRFYLP